MSAGLVCALVPWKAARVGEFHAVNLAFQPKLVWIAGQKVPCAANLCTPLSHGTVGYVVRTFQQLSQVVTLCFSDLQVQSVR